MGGEFANLIAIQIMGGREAGDAEGEDKVSGEGVGDVEAEVRGERLGGAGAEIVEQASGANE
jgi:hypothetical protein